MESSSARPIMGTVEADQPDLVSDAGVVS